MPIDGPGKVLGQAGPTVLRPGTFLPAWGVMSFDTADLAKMEADGSLVRVIMHEMAHVLGFGSIWDRLGLLQGAGSADPTFTGAAAIREFATLRGETTPLAVPVANVGGPGTRDSHWREAVFGNELMTGFLNTGVNPISRLSVGSLEDLGYEVDYAAADPYTLPTPQAMAIMGVGAAGRRPRRPRRGALPAPDRAAGRRAARLTPGVSRRPAPRRARAARARSPAAPAVRPASGCRRAAAGRPWTRSSWRRGPAATRMQRRAGVGIRRAGRDVQHVAVAALAGPLASSSSSRSGAMSKKPCSSTMLCSSAPPALGRQRVSTGPAAAEAPADAGAAVAVHDEVRVRRRPGPWSDVHSIRASGGTGSVTGGGTASIRP